jgi:hypothetical protein
VLQKQWEVSLKYAMFATPIGYLVDERGILASDVAIGVGPILALAREGVHESYVTGRVEMEQSVGDLNRLLTT